MASDADPAPRTLRASDDDRERTAQVVREAVAAGRLAVHELDERLEATFAAVTVEALRAVLEDLVPVGELDVVLAQGTLPAAAPVGTMPVRRGDHDRTAWALAIMGGSDRKGHWRVERRLNVVNVMGGADLDLTDAELASDVVDIRVISIMGGANVIVPPGVDLQVSEIAIMGGNDVQTTAEPAPPGAPVVRIRIVSIMGGTEVRRRRRRTRKERRAEREDQRTGGDLQRPERDDRRAGRELPSAQPDDRLVDRPARNPAELSDADRHGLPADRGDRSD